MLNYGLDVKPMRMVASPNSGPRHTIDNILGLVRKEENDRAERAHTPGNGESAGKNLFTIFIIYSFLHYSTSAFTLL